MKDKYNPAGYLYASLAYFLWGFTPLFWKQLNQIPALQLLVYRLCATMALLWAIRLITKNRFSPGLLKKQWLSVFISGILLATNWLIFIFATNNGYLQDASLGYYINPLVSIFLGMLFFKERLHWLEWLALAGAAAGVIYLSLQIGRFPWLSLLLAFSFGFYGLFKKRSAFTPLQGLSLEVAFLFPFLLGYFFLGMDGINLIRQGLRDFAIVPVILLLLSGPLTVFPLVLYGKAVGSINLSAAGFLQFLSPTLMLIISLTLFHEPLPAASLPGFILVWLALGIYIAARFRKDSV